MSKLTKLTIDLPPNERDLLAHAAHFSKTTPEKMALYLLRRALTAHLRPPVTSGSRRSEDGDGTTVH